MAEHGEWNRKGATISDVTATKEYGVGRDFIVKGIRAGRLEYREGAIWGNPYIRLLRRELEHYIIEELGAEHLRLNKTQAKLREIKKEMTALRKRLDELQGQRTEIEKTLMKLPTEAGDKEDAPTGARR